MQKYMTDELGRKVSILQVLYKRVTDDGSVCEVYTQHCDPKEHWRPGTDEQGDVTLPTPIEEPQFMLRCEASVPPWPWVINERYFRIHVVSVPEWYREDEYHPPTMRSIDAIRWYSNAGQVGVDILNNMLTDETRHRLGIGDEVSIVRVAPL